MGFFDWLLGEPRKRKVSKKVRQKRALKKFYSAAKAARRQGVKVVAKRQTRKSTYWTRQRLQSRYASNQSRYRSLPRSK